MQEVKQNNGGMLEILNQCTKLESLCKQNGGVLLGVCHECQFIGIGLEYMKINTLGDRERPFCK
jgi:hypothetical protein